MNKNNEIEPPWVKFPNYSPADTFWRQSGEPWFTLVWKPYWDSLNREEQENYLQRWDAPQVWRRFYFDLDFQEWLRSVDD